MQGAWGDVGGSLSAELGFLGTGRLLICSLVLFPFFTLWILQFHYYVFDCIHDVGGGAHATAYVWRSGDNLTELVPYEDSRVGIRFSKLSG